jgi:deazaflavin-dependent oxidoreductase (nitroreductase family)
MAREYQAAKAVNTMVKWMNRFGLGRSETMSTTGRVTGEQREVPVSPISVDGVEYLVAPYGEVSWVHNVRSDPMVTMRRGRRVRRCELIEVTDQAAEIVKAYWDRERFPRPYMDVPGNATVGDFSSVAGRFPVFRVEEGE